MSCVDQDERLFSNFVLDHGNGIVSTAVSIARERSEGWTIFRIEILFAVVLGFRNPIVGVGKGVTIIDPQCWANRCLFRSDTVVIV